MFIKKLLQIQQEKGKYTLQQLMKILQDTTSYVKIQQFQAKIRMEDICLRYIDNPESKQGIYPLGEGKFYIFIRKNLKIYTKLYQLTSVCIIQQVYNQHVKIF